MWAVKTEFNILDPNSPGVQTLRCERKGRFPLKPRRWLIKSRLECTMARTYSYESYCNPPVMVYLKWHLSRSIRLHIASPTPLHMNITYMNILDVCHTNRLNNSKPATDQDGAMSTHCKHHQHCTIIILKASPLTTHAVYFCDHNFY